MNDAWTVPSLGEAWKKHFLIGAAVTPRQLQDAKYQAMIKRHFTSLTAENGMKPERILDHAATVKTGDPIRAALVFSRVDDMLSFARKSGIAVRFHTLCWHNQTPRWFFARDWRTEEDAPLVEKDAMAARLRDYIRQVMEHVNGYFPGVVYAWDVVNEAIEPDHGAEGCFRTKSLWYQVMGPDFVSAAFRAARQHQAPGQKLYYNDFNTFQPVKRDAMISLLRSLTAEKLVDGVGMQAHLQWDAVDIAACETAARMFGDLGLALQVTEMDIHCPGQEEDKQQALARAYGAYFAMLRRLQRDGYTVESATLWGVTDGDTWLRYFRKEGSWPLLFTENKEAKPAFFAVLQEAED